MCTIIHLIKKNALIHELAHRLLFGHDLYAPDEYSQEDNDEIRALLIQGDVINDIYGKANYSSWASFDPNEHTKEYIKDLRYVLSLSKEKRSTKTKNTAQLKS